MSPVRGLYEFSDFTFYANSFLRAAPSWGAAGVATQAVGNSGKKKTAAIYYAHARRALIIPCLYKSVCFQDTYLYIQSSFHSTAALVRIHLGLSHQEEVAKDLPVLLVRNSPSRTHPRSAPSDYREHHANDTIDHDSTLLALHFHFQKTSPFSPKTGTMSASVVLT